ncbi:transcriptional regulator [Ruegeria sp. 2205SS24-7]|uniref:helix-turn-helix domain-containing protein n=1 Tax=Ruegeria discodermiae TaxID=3064389 RepID=UPI002740FC33|nr:transcriptional regulator [Ruegeria sp. 2205SS24-7]MDP5220921.1 transcriptional regulator [Ruegeria sp. 2205SS24-7]
MNEFKKISGDQVRMAKGALGMTNPQLAAETGLHRNTINRAEKGEGKLATFDHLRRYFEGEGLEFIPENGGGSGVRFKSKANDSE